VKPAKQAPQIALKIPSFDKKIILCLFNTMHSGYALSRPVIARTADITFTNLCYGAVINNKKIPKAHGMLRHWGIG
jgi:hypothetical protein